MTQPVLKPVGLHRPDNDDCVRIFIRDCKVLLRVGVFENERNEAQPVTVTVEMEAALPCQVIDPGEHDLARVINYAPLYDFIRTELPKQGHFSLLEAAAEYLLDYCFRDRRIERATVRLEKTAVFEYASGAGIEVSRTRKGRTA